MSWSTDGRLEQLVAALEGERDRFLEVRDLATAAAVAYGVSAREVAGALAVLRTGVSPDPGGLDLAEDWRTHASLEIRRVRALLEQHADALDLIVTGFGEIGEVPERGLRGE